MSVWNNLLNWAVKAATSQQAKQAELKAVQAATNQLSEVLAKKVPDLHPIISPLLDQVVSHAVSGIMSKAG